MKKHKKWEYIVKGFGELWDDGLNELGGQGWEVVAMSSAQVIFKRELHE